MSFAIFDIETRVEKALVKEVYFPREDLTPEEAYTRVRAKLLEERETDFFPISFHIPISIAVGDVTSDRVLRAVKVLAEEDYSEERLVRAFWERVEAFPGTLVTFNGRQFDLPVLELQALKYGCPARRYFEGKHRHRFSDEGHYDLYDFLTNMGMYRVRGGFHLLARLIGLPGKQSLDGSMIQSLWEAGRLAEIHQYCRRDVIQTYALLLRLELVRGRISPPRYEEALGQSAPFLKELAD